MNPGVVLSDLFADSYKKLDGSIKQSVLDFIVKLQGRPDLPGLDLKVPQGVTDSRIKTARVDKFWRAVLVELPQSAGYILVAVRPHDDAYTYATQLRFGVNEVTGALEVVNQAALEHAIADTTASTPEAASVSPVLRKARSRDLQRFGMAEDVAERLVRITDEDQLLTVAETLPAVQANAVLDLAAGRTVDEVWHDLIAEEARDVDTADVLEALERPLSRLTFTDGRSAEELRAVLEGDFQAWRVWLHPLQRRLARHTGWRGPYRVTGGAGTGKTVTAIHRARHLADRLERQGAPGTVLFTTFTKNLAQNIETQLHELAGPEIGNRVDVVHIDALAQRVLRTGVDSGVHRPQLRGDNSDAVRRLWDTARELSAEQWDREFLSAEWNEVVLAQGITDQATYLRTSRSGRGRRVSRPQRAELWAIFERFTQLLNAENLMTFTQAASRAATLAERLATDSGPDTDSGVRKRERLRYPHAVIDEAQDLHPAHWRLLRALVSPGEDDLFIVGDAHQRIYGKPIVLSRYGIHTRGRSRRLTVNYRTSRQILDWSLRIAYGHTVDDLDGETESLAGARSEFTGPEPQAQGFTAETEERAALAETLRSWSAAEIAWSQMAVVTRTRKQVEQTVTALADSGVPVAALTGNTEENTLGDRVRVMTMHRIKGLEYLALAVFGAGENELPPHVRELPEDARAAAWKQDQSLLYVAASRAREHLRISWTGQPSSLLNHVLAPGSSPG